MGLTGTTSEERGLTIAHLYQKVCYTGLTGTTSEERGLTIAHLYQRMCYMGLTGATSEERGLTIAHLYQRVCYSCGNLPVIRPEVPAYGGQAYEPDGVDCVPHPLWLMLGYGWLVSRHNPKHQVSTLY